YGISYPNDIKDFLFGSGPGTFNSRTAFMVGSPTYFTKLPFIKDTEQPYYFKNYAYSLWNPSNNSKALYLDGFRNQPFSSILAFLGEFGFIFFLAFFALYYMYYLKVKNLYKSINTNPEARTNFIFFKFLIILLPLLLLIDNFYEYPEIMLPVLIGIKLSHLALVSLKNTIHANK
ncbi:MAG: hypothetical protein J7497_15510, partial [Chitinophagaceae bacterium]|nr:hypothetical protein [Chitinophagaceae bacterium]